MASMSPSRPPEFATYVWYDDGRRSTKAPARRGPAPGPRGLCRRGPAASRGNRAQAARPTGDAGAVPRPRGSIRDRQPHPLLRARHLGAAVRPVGADPVRRARGGPPARGHHANWRASGTTPSSAGSPGRRCACSTTCASSTAGSISPVPIGDRRRHAAGRAQPHATRRCCPPGSAPTPTTPASSPCALNLAAEGARRSSRAGHQGHAAAGQGGARSGWPPTSTTRQDVVAVRAGPGWPSSTSPSDEIDALFADGRHRPRRRAGAAVPHRAAAARRRLAALGRVDAGQAGAAGARRPRGVRAARPLGRAADRAGPAARRDGRHRVARRPGRHRQVGAGAVRRPGGGAGAPHAPQGRRVPAALRRRRAGARLPARQREREDGALGAGGLRHPRRAGQPGRCSRRCSPAACSRCCR